MSRRSRLRRGERGLAVVIVGMVLMVLMTITALVIDHSFLRNDRRADQKIADAAASAGALALGTGNGQDACEAALATLVANTPSVSSFDGADCSGFAEFCNPATGAAQTVGTSGDYRIEIVHPVPAGHALMARASAIGAPVATAVESDGTQCERVGVAIELTRGPAFGVVLGAQEQDTRVHSVAKTGSELDGERPINLLILERSDCHAVVAEGQAELEVGAITGWHGELLPGILAVDSSAYEKDGSLGDDCGTLSSPGYGTLHVQGKNARVQADGPPLCPTELTPGTGDGCGFLELYAPGVPGPASPLFCEGTTNWPACTSTGIARPHPVRMAERRTREPIDHHFNCQSGYGSKPWFGGHPIGSCAEATSDTDFVDELMSFVNGNSTPSGFTTFSDCAPSTDVVVPEGNIVVDCDPFVVKTSVTFTGGNVIFNGSVDVTSSTGDLTVHACGRESDAPGTTAIASNSCSPTNPLDVDDDVLTADAWTGLRDERGRWLHADDFAEAQYSNDAAWVAFRNGGGIKKDAQARVHIYDSTLFFQRGAAISSTHAMALSGGSGSLIWHAPREGPFDVLSMWSDSPLLHDMGGQAALEMEGVYFAPVARLTFRGSGSQQQVAAQLITEQLSVTGSGTLIVVPQVDRSINHYRPPSSMIIR